MSAEFPWESWYHREHDDLCKVEARNYVLEQRIKALEKDQVEDDDRIALLEQHAKNQKTRIEELRAALREIAVATRTHATVSYWTDVEVEMLKDIARKALGEE